MSSPPARGFFRRALRPFTRPIDGRFEDVNRRVGDVGGSISAITEAVENLARELGAYAATATESNAYVGVEARRLQEALDALVTHIDEHETRTYARIDALEATSFNERVNRAAEGSLDRLEGAVANLVNHAVGYRGFAAQAGLWFNPPVTVQLTEGRARLASVNERIVEMPYAFAALARRQPPARILEIGSAESTLSLSLASLGYQVTAIDLNPLPYSHPNLKSIVGRFEDWQPGSERFDVAFLVSTIEHFGLGAYGEEATNGSADRNAVQRIRELLAPEGFMVLTTPYGRPRVDALERIYDDDALTKLLAGWTVLDRRVLVRSDEQIWVPVPADADGGPGDEPGVVMVIAAPAPG